MFSVFVILLRFNRLLNGLKQPDILLSDLRLPFLPRSVPCHPTMTAYRNLVPLANPAIGDTPFADRKESPVRVISVIVEPIIAIGLAAARTFALKVRLRLTFVGAYPPR